MSSREKLLWVTVLRVILEVSQSCRHRDILQIRSDTEKKVPWQGKGVLYVSEVKENFQVMVDCPLWLARTLNTLPKTTSLSSATPYESMRVIFFQTTRATKTLMVFFAFFFFYSFFVFQVLLRTWNIENINAWNNCATQTRIFILS